MYTVAVIPISVGSAAAYGVEKTGSFSVFALFLLAAIAIIAWLNLSNDVFDSDTGVDANKAHSLVNLTGNRRLVFWLSNAFLVLGLGGVLAITALQQDFTVLGLILVCCALGYSYQGPPFRLGYLGLGEIICFLTFGPGAVSAAYYSQSQSFSPALLFPALFVGLSTSIILFCSHFHQVEDDLAAGKLSPVVRLDTQTGAWVLIGSLTLLFLLPVGAVLFRLAPLTSLLTLLSFPFALQLAQKMRREHDQPALVSNSKFVAVNLHFCSGLLLALAYLFA
jgi:1,4-dihydroxy-2-naphthoate octaprenyltransferase